MNKWMIGTLCLLVFGCKEDKTTVISSSAINQTFSLAQASSSATKSGKMALPFSGLYLSIGWLSNWKGSGDLAYANDQAQLKGGKWSRRVVVIPDSTDTPVYIDGRQDSLVVRRIDGEWVLWNTNSNRESKWIQIESLEPIDFSVFNPNTHWHSQGRISLDDASLDRVAPWDNSAVQALLASNQGQATALSDQKLQQIMNAQKSSPTTKPDVLPLPTDCDVQAFLSSLDPLRSAEVNPAQGQKRLYFHREGACPNGQEFCPTDAFVIRKDQVLLAQSQGDWVCGLFPNQAGYAMGWLKQAELSPSSDPEPDNWNGVWMGQNRRVEIADGAYDISLDISVNPQGLDPKDFHSTLNTMLGSKAFAMDTLGCKILVKKFGKQMILKTRGICPADYQGFYRLSKGEADLGTDQLLGRWHSSQAGYKCS